jgi:hypothetical protein
MVLHCPLSMRERVRVRVRVRGKKGFMDTVAPLIRPSATFSFRPFGSSGRRVERKISANQV